MAKGRSKRKALVQTTLLVVGEGADDKAFITHMKQIFCPRGSGRRAKVEAGDGGSPGNIITNAVRSFRGEDYDHRILVLDSDVPPTEQDRRKAKSNGYTIILWSPTCLEGALLDVLGEPVREHESASSLKKRLHPALDGAHTSSDAYQRLFPEPVLTATTNKSVVSLRQTLRQEANCTTC
ncbi:hypothetical protein MSNKSG1_14762 [Marinobacter santoriniensis NKSG1]|uniref:RloB domain-containing protein n=1 Tax=Marinobacter santoriniensis NKSG1 TaxID=1288826 RepID=M7CR59_9GAMM|nr:hypothetical protein [Marinobacter santoriniensis]EMP54580.1 hypothetical protein MSNKSG1_14762 [Marinobacter santoriniensis NKSG1]